MTKKIIIGLDPSFTGTGIYIDNGEETVLKTDAEESVGNRIVSIWAYLKKLMARYDNNVVVGIEGFSFMSKGRAVGNMYGLGWFLRCSLEEMGIEYYEIPINSWKKYLFKRNFRRGLGKDHLLLETYKRYDKDFDNNNICDAFNIMKLTKALYLLKTGEFKLEDLSKVDADVLKKLL